MHKDMQNAQIAELAYIGLWGIWAGAGPGKADIIFLF